ncbi:rabenosyn-5 [Brevipalpus obovatus]|uniref:rabenosyn-5 n=1 Tax=Brevipalpus obovatus TaxID=246614 RepID=UPI003D9E7C78
MSSPSSGQDVGPAERQDVRCHNRDSEPASSSSSRSESSKNNILIGKKRFPFKWPIELKVGILQPDESTSSEILDREPLISPNVDEFYKINQAMGPKRSHWSALKKRRDERIEYCVMETNKLLVRLDKLLKEAPQDPKDHKLHLQNIVNWANDEDVTLCPQCARGFNFLFRRHHCRLCGGIMCGSCSQFLDPNYANELVSPVDLETGQLLASSISSPDGNLKRRSSLMSLPSISSSLVDSQVRICKYCKELLDRRNQLMHDKHSKSMICQLYERYREFINESEKLVKQYYRILETLYNGEATNIKLEHHHGLEVRAKLMSFAEKIDTISRKIAKFGSQGDAPLNSAQMRLQSQVRTSAVHYVHNNLSSLPSLPTVEELENLRLGESNSFDCSQADSKYNRFKQSLDNSFAKPERGVNNDEGWTPEVKNLTKEQVADMDPLLLQINQITDYIQMARRANKYDEAKMLEANRTELEIEYMMQNLSNGDVNQS